MNKQLFKFESSKLNKAALITLTVAFISQISFLLFFALIGSLDKSSSDGVLSNSVGIGSISSTITLSIISIYAAVLMNHSIVENYTGESRIRLYSYPGGRSKLFLAKVYAFIIRIIVPQFIGLLAANGLFWLANSAGIFRENWTSGMTALLLLLLLSVVTVLVTITTVLLSMIVGIRFSSTQLTLVSVIIIIALLGNLIAQSFASMLVLSSFIVLGLVIGSLVVVRIWAAKIEKEEVL